MKILTVVVDLSKGGTQRAAQFFAEGYRELGHDSRLLACSSLGSRSVELNEQNIYTWFKVNPETLNQILDWKPHIIHLHSHGLNPHEIDALLNAVPESTLILEQNVFSIPSPWSKRLTSSFQLSKWCLWKYSNYNQDQNLRAKIVPYPVKTKNFHKISLDSIVSFKRSIGVPLDDIVIGRVGQSHIGKWSGDTIDSFNAVSRSRDNLSMILVNPPKEIVSLAEASQYSSKIKIIDHIYGDSNLRKVYNAFDIFLHAADQGESFGYVLTEAMLCEVPVVTLSTPWGDNSQCEVVGHKRGGLVASSYKGLVQCLEDLIGDKEKRLFLGKQARLKVIDDYDYMHVCRQVLESPGSQISFQSISASEIASIAKQTADGISLFTVLAIRYPKLLFLTRHIAQNRHIRKKVLARLKRLFIEGLRNIAMK